MLILSRLTHSLLSCILHCSWGGCGRSMVIIGGHLPITDDGTISSLARVTFRLEWKHEPNPEGWNKTSCNI